ncbi:glutathione S-transferase family protein [Paraburkholderia megapolitana]|uniref:Glutathione S-transferase n=1 Tax=Paraburkholderia megapolitana TaxID=420953 RepID=A0A1I3FRT6_9BURK|nr:glutathione S-transferase [Paraburkholderia megapolitana]QDQ82523.1 glutathione S-transferase [Paraburkholderia megapolitana]SFI13988.1 glutathione S-transferase [Paraburkholderia megapolitana]
MKLYYWPKTRAFRALWMLEEIGARYELVHVNIRAGEQGTADYRDVNPMTKLPALDDHGVRVAESGAVLLYLADRFPAANLGATLDDPLRGRFLQWLFFTPGCLEPAMAEKITGASGNTFSFGWGDFDRVRHAVDGALEEGEWLLGERFTAADLLLAGTLQIAFAAKLLEPKGRIGDFVERAVSRDGHARAVAVEQRELAALKVTR